MEDLMKKVILLIALAASSTTLPMAFRRAIAPVQQITRIYRQSSSLTRIDALMGSVIALDKAANNLRVSEAALDLAIQRSQDRLQKLELEKMTSRTPKITTREAELINLLKELTFASVTYSNDAIQGAKVLVDAIELATQAKPLAK
jgi:hypothetical protein